MLTSGDLLASYHWELPCSKKADQRRLRQVLMLMLCIEDACIYIYMNLLTCISMWECSNYCLCVCVFVCLFVCVCVCVQVLSIEAELEGFLSRGLRHSNLLQYLSIQHQYTHSKINVEVHVLL